MNQITTRRIKTYISIVIIGLVISGITAFPIESELALLAHPGNSTMNNWLNTIYQAVKTTNQNYPWLSYGTDWLAFAHIMLAVLFIGPLRDPVKNIWVIEFGMIACVAIFPLALIAGGIRGIPLFWRLIDCSFGVMAFVPLYLTYRAVKKLDPKQI
ncbi:hypothetical protein BEL04_22415 [Mucilaginibacter sp. PPCGB 2223]|uniref:hypothetical protein n=1 Tax=Mucilaginibacter sp. PPCGB 2223 TaxID=1886027 RepID=UPI0008260F51|nr:hypothetical protein [Mucilaginibacter sp. PPCGB 2223]OCX50534.1 hypothetical protein BEL04_22415 [Mucilaginibacter sp. PPCGB 2223]